MQCTAEKSLNMYPAVFKILNKNIYILLQPNINHKSFDKLFLNSQF